MGKQASQQRSVSNKKPETILAEMATFGNLRRHQARIEQECRPI
jgi:hypothetical protein